MSDICSTPTSLSHTHTLIDRHTNSTNITSTHNTIATTHSSSNAMHHSHTTHTSHTNTHSPFIRSYSNTLTKPNPQNQNLTIHNNISNTTQITQQTHQSTQLAKLLSGEYTLILFAYQKTPAYHTTYHIQNSTTNQSLARQAPPTPNSPIILHYLLDSMARNYRY